MNKLLAVIILFLILTSCATMDKRASYEEFAKTKWPPYPYKTKECYFEIGKSNSYHEIMETCFIYQSYFYGLGRLVHIYRLVLELDCESRIFSVRKAEKSTLKKEGFVTVEELEFASPRWVNVSGLYPNDCIKDVYRHCCEGAELKSCYYSIEYNQD